MAVAARKATMSAPTFTQLMPSCEAAAFFLYMSTARRPSSGEIVHMCGKDCFPSYKGHIFWVWVLFFILRGSLLEADASG